MAKAQLRPSPDFKSSAEPKFWDLAKLEADKMKARRRKFCIFDSNTNFARLEMASNASLGRLEARPGSKKTGSFHL